MASTSSAVQHLGVRRRPRAPARATAPGRGRGRPTTCSTALVGRVHDRGDAARGDEAGAEEAPAHRRSGSPRCDRATARPRPTRSRPPSRRARDATAAAVTVMGRPRRSRSASSRWKEYGAQPGVGEPRDAAVAVRAGRAAAGESAGASTSSASVPMSVRDTIRSVRHWPTIAPSVPSTYHRGLSAAARSEWMNSASAPSAKRMVTREWSALVTSNQRRLWDGRGDVLDVGGHEVEDLVEDVRAPVVERAAGHALVGVPEVARVPVAADERLDVEDLAERAGAHGTTYGEVVGVEAAVLVDDGEQVRRRRPRASTSSASLGADRERLLDHDVLARADRAQRPRRRACSAASRPPRGRRRRGRAGRRRRQWSRCPARPVGGGVAAGRPRCRRRGELEAVDGAGRAAVLVPDRAVAEQPDPDAAGVRAAPTACRSSADAALRRVAGSATAARGRAEGEGGRSRSRGATSSRDARPGRRRPSAAPRRRRPPCRRAAPGR